MFIKLDAKGLEWRAFAHLSQDEVAINEIKNDANVHSDNQFKFNLPTRLIAKIFLFRAIYKGSAYAYSVDNDFKHLGGVKYWQGVIDAFYDKYKGGYTYHENIIASAKKEGQLVSETGRIYLFEPRYLRGQLQWPISDIVNYPVQGFSADIMSLVRVACYNRLKKWQNQGYEVLLVNTVHDSVVIDTNHPEWYAIAMEMRQVFRDIPLNYKKIYGKELLVPMDAEIKVGINILWGHEVV